MRIRRKVFTVFACCVLFLSFLSASAFGAVFDVTDTAGLASALTTAATNGEADTINVAAGTYDVTSVLSYTSTEAYPLAIQGAGADDTILRGDGCQILSIAASDSVLVDGLTFVNGRGEYGGGLYVVVTNAALTVTNCVFRENFAEDSGLGGGAYVNSTGTSPERITFQDNVFMMNWAANSGGGLYTTGSTFDNYELVLSGNLFFGNQARKHNGGGAYVLASGYTAAASFIEKNTFRNNYAGGNGGGLLAALGSYRSLSQYGGTVRNNLFSRNWSELNGGGAYFDVNISGTAKVINNTCIENIAGTGGGFYFYLRDNTDSDGWDVTANIYNNIIGNNSAISGTDFYINNEYLPGFCNVATVNLYNNDYPASGMVIVSESNLTQSGNIDVNAHIVGWGDIASDSPCIDAGQSPYSPEDDIHGEDRPNGKGIDIGADENYDTDKDGLPDYWETSTGETEWDADPDDDGFSNLEEYEYGIDPLVPTYDASGEWDITITSFDTDCSDIDVEDTTVTITQVEDYITLQVDDQTFTGVFNGLDSTYYLGADQTEEGNILTFRITFSLTTESSGTGTISWFVTDDATDEITCDGSADFEIAPAGADDDDHDSGLCFIQTAR